MHAGRRRITSGLGQSRHGQFKLLVSIVLFTIGIAAYGAAPAAATEPGPIAAYSFDENEGTVAHDSAGTHTATIEGAEWTLGKYGSALNFNAKAKSVLTIPGTEDLRFEKFTLEAWVAPSESLADAALIAHTNPEDYGYGLWDGGELAGKPEGFITNKKSVSSYAFYNTVLPPGSWTHLALTCDQTKLRLYVNGELVDERPAVKVKAGKGDLKIGGTEGLGAAEYFSGKIDEVRLYNRALSQAEIKTDRHTAISSPPSADPIAAYPFDENEGTLAHDAASSHDATISGANWSTGKFGSSLSFNATKSNVLTVPDTEDLHLEEFTLSAWVYPTENRQWAPVIAKTDPSGHGYALFAGGEVAGLPEGVISYHESVDSYVFGAKGLPLNEWSYLAVTSDRKKLRLYVNGELVRELEGDDVQATSGAPLQIGGDTASGWEGYFGGKLDEPRLYSRALSAAEIKEDQNAAVLAQAPGGCTLTSPIEGTQSAKWLNLSAACSGKSGAEETEWLKGVNGVTFQYREGKTGPFQTIPASLVRNAKREEIRWPAPFSSEGKQGEALYFDAAHATSKLRKEGGPIQIRAVFERKAGGERSSPPNEAAVNRRLGGPTDATESVGPGTLDLLTGNLSVTETDVSIASFNSSLEFTRTFNSRETESGTVGPLGPGWKASVPVEEVGESEWKNLKFTTETETIEGKSYSFEYALIAGLEGAELAFEKVGEAFITPPEISGWTLTKAGSSFVLSDPEGNTTTFEPKEGEYLPVAVSEAGGTKNTTQMEYELSEKQKRLTKVIGPAAPGVTCTPAFATSTEGCKVLVFSYASMTKWGGEASLGKRLEKITYYAEGFSGGPWTVAEYTYNSAGRLTEEWDPRISPALKTKYTYNASGQLATITPPGQEPWTLEYASFDEETGPGRLLKVKRPSLVESHTTAQTTIAYNVPIAGSGAPYEMGPATVAKWGQADLPSEATAIFPPDEEPSSPPSSYSHATVQYMDAEGRAVNVATAAGAGTSSASISTSEYDQFSNVVRELTPQNRLRALAAGTESVTRSKELDTHRVYWEEGTEMVQEWGPLHQVRLESGTTTNARWHTIVAYDEGMPVGTTPDPHLPTAETTGAEIPGGSWVDLRLTNTKYNWTLREPTETIVDPSGLNIRRVTAYDEKTRLPIETRQPSDTGGEGAGTTKTFYYNESPKPKKVKCEKSAAWTGLPCAIEPAAQPGTAGQPELLVTQYKSYNALGEPTEVIESPGGGEANTRKTITTFDAAGRLLTKKIEGGGEAIPRVETTYSSSLGLPTSERFVCETSCAGFDNQETKATYDALGRVKEYEDADGNVAKTTYDVDGRPVTMSDGKGSQTYTYDSVTGLLTKLEDSAAGTFTAAYDADGNQTERTLPDGLTAKTTFNEADEPTALSYVKASSCGASCNWLEQSVERSINGQILAESGTLESKQYAYDKASRLTEAKETPTGGSCTTRLYTYDADSNRKSMTTRSPGIGGACGTSGGSEQKYEYDSADRLLGTGLTYDNFGRVTSLPAAYAGGKTLTTSYFSDDMLASQTQNGVTNSYELDGSLRQRTRLQGGGGIEGVEVFHYDGPSDGVAWTQRGSVWSRSITGINGELAAIQESSGTTTLPLTNLHGDVVANAALSSSETKLLATYRYDEFGNPVSGSAGRFSWLGGKARRTELASGVIQMGARSYVSTLGRFISTDPILGGSSSPYDYSNADPVNGLDLAGTCSNSRCDRQPAVSDAAHTGRSVQLPAPECTFNGVATDSAYVTSDGVFGHQIRARISWACTTRVKVTAWIRVRGAGASGQVNLGSKAVGGGGIGTRKGHEVLYPGTNFRRFAVCVRFSYSGGSRKVCKPVTVRRRPL